MNNESNVEQVVANLIATYNVNGTDEQSVKSIDYLCIYEYEYNGVKYKYRMHQKDNFEPIPEQLELCVLKKDPSRAFKKIKTNNDSHNRAKMSPITICILCLIFIGVPLYSLYSLFDFFTEIDMKYLFVFIIAVVLICIISLKNKKNTKNKDELIEDAIVNGRTATAYLKKVRKYYFGDEPHARLGSIYYKEFPYKGTYTYEYNGKNYKKSFWLSNYPSKTIKVYFNKNPKDIIQIK